MKTNRSLHRLGIIGGSGLSDLPLEKSKAVRVQTPFGDPSSEILLGDFNGSPVAFLQRHGPGHRIPPSRLNTRANIAALRHLGCARLLSFSAVGSLQEKLAPGTFVLVDQFIDRTFQREKTFFGDGMVTHVSFGDPTCERMRAALNAAGLRAHLPIVKRGTYVVMEGPQFSTRAESNLYRSWGASVIGMTAMPEAKLAREAEMCYALVAMPTDYDCWKKGEHDVTAGLVADRMKQIVENATVLLAAACSDLVQALGDCPCGCNKALDAAIMTAPLHRSREMLARLHFVAPRFRSNQSPVNQPEKTIWIN